MLNDGPEGFRRIPINTGKGGGLDQFGVTTTSSQATVVAGGGATVGGMSRSRIIAGV